MSFFKKNSFPIIFLLFFSGAMVIFGSLQALIGTLRWYNPSEERHESLSSQKTYSANFYSAMSPAKNNESIIIYLTKNSADTEQALSTLPADKAQKIQEKITEYEEWYDTQSSTPEPTETRPESPVLLTVKPSHSAYPLGYESMVYDVTTGKYFIETLWDFPVIIDTERVNPRGQMKDESVTLSGKIKTIAEATKVLVHELGHMVDLYVLKNTSTKRDPSQKYYDISWSEPTVIRSDMPQSAFVSGYAATNQYEDFAEAFTFYIFHNAEFQRRAKKIPELQEKYDFFRQYVFGDYFRDSSYEAGVIPKTFWDVTKITLKKNMEHEVFTFLERIFPGVL